jgi:hypothetical protein
VQSRQKQREHSFFLVMSEELLTIRDSAHRLGIAATSLYQWLGQSDSGTLVMRGQPVTVDYLQGGPKGQGRIRIAAGEIERLKDLMRVHPSRHLPRRPVVKQEHYPGITVKLGRPQD